MKNSNILAAIFPILLFINGCTSSLMQKSALENSVLPPTIAEHAQVVFMRPSTFGGAIQSSVFDLQDNRNSLTDDVFVGIVSATTKITYAAPPGFHLFMVIGENADFMQANLAANKTYYARVTPRFGWWKARFSLKPVHLNQLQTDDFEDDFRSTDWYENTAASLNWAKKNWPSIQEKKNEYLQDWKEKTESEINEATLNEVDSQ